MFGEPDAAGHRPSFDAVLDRVEWWAEVFECPASPMPRGSKRFPALVEAGADFVAVGGAVFDDPRGVRAALAEAAARLGNAGGAP